jgi:RND family efflux transporter MFP subunit
VAVGVVAVPAALVARGTTPKPVQVKATVTRRTIATEVKATGVIKPRVGAEVRVGSRASGVVGRLLVQIGDAVRKGDLLAELDTRELLAREDQAEAALASASAQLDYALADLRRKQALEGLIAAGDLDLAKRGAAVAEQQRAEAAAALTYARTQLAYARIEAPISGVVSSVATQEGETVSASLAAPTFVTLVDLSRLEVWAYVDETDIGRIQLGQLASFSVDTYGDQAFEGRVSAIYPQPAIRDNVVNYVTVIRFAPPQRQILRPEMTASVRIALESREGVIAVPRGAVRREAGRTLVACLRGGEVVDREVRTGLRDETWWEIVEGLSENETVIMGKEQR